MAIATLLLLASSAFAQDFYIRNATVHTATAQGTLRNADVHVRDGRIVAVGANL
ncbi:MAG TPA: amidohydrolase, partial [Pseudoxanthomonas sp.]|nr:amidohydrolase [Pseudoxanthomonas sp.]